MSSREEAFNLNRIVQYGCLLSISMGIASMFLSYRCIMHIRPIDAPTIPDVYTVRPDYVFITHLSIEASELLSKVKKQWTKA